MKNTRLRTVIEIIKEAGNIALRYFGKIEASRKTDQSVVTEADVVVGEYLKKRLKLNFPDYGIINEEDNCKFEIIPDNRKLTWVIDPIDGTSAYSRRFPIWGVAVGLLKGIKPVAGFIYLPVTDEFYYTDEDFPATFESGRWGVQKLDVSSAIGVMERESLLLTVSYAHKCLKINFPGKARSLGSISAHMCYVARGDAVAAVVRGALWDIVPGWAIIKKAGGTGIFIDGSEVDFTKMSDGKPCENFILVASEQNVKNLISKITPFCP